MNRRRQRYDRGYAASVRIRNGELPVMRSDDRRADRKPKAQAMFLGGEIMLENAFEVIW
jgi:hypothetical protein